MKENVQKITGRHTVCGVIGDPIEHTLSPVIHNELAKAMEQPMIYVPFHVTKGNLKEAILGAHALGIKGLNVTMPHKQELFNYVTEVDASAQKIGAINTLVYTKEGYKGYNTDAIGLAFALEAKGIEWKGKNVAIIGGGGAAYATYVAVAKEARSIHLFNRTLENIQTLKNHMQAHFNTPTFLYKQEQPSNVAIDMVIQTTGVGMGAYINEMPICTKRVLGEAKTAIDLIYAPKETLFLKYAKEQGCQIENGFGMLFYQAVEAFKLMHGINCNIECIPYVKKKIAEDLHL